MQIVLLVNVETVEGMGTRNLVKPHHILCQYHIRGRFTIQVLMLAKVKTVECMGT